VDSLGQAGLSDVGLMLILPHLRRYPAAPLNGPRALPHFQICFDLFSTPFFIFYSIPGLSICFSSFEMSSTQTIELEPIRPLRSPEPLKSSDVPPVAPFGAVAIPNELNPAPEGQRVFQQESFSAMGKSRKIAILVLIVGCNFVQVSPIVLLRATI
jgi:hypothetical protein